MLLGTERDFVALRYAILKFLTVNLFLCGSEPIFFCLEYISVFYKIMIKKDFLLAQITFFASIVIWFTIPRYFPQRAHVKESVAIFEGPHVFGQFRLVSSVPVPCRKDVKWFLYRSLKLVACLMSVVTFRPYETEL